MAVNSSKLEGFYRLGVAERRALAAAAAQCTVAELEDALDSGGLSPDIADKIVENVLGTYALPFGVATNFKVNGVDYLVPMVVEEPSVIAAASNAAQRVRLGGGFEAAMVSDLMTAQVEVHAVADLERARAALLAERSRLLELSANAVPRLVARGGGPRDLSVRTLGDGYLVVHVDVDCKDAMGANLVNTIAEYIGPEIAKIAGGTLGLRILTNLCDKRLVKVSCHVPPEGLVSKDVLQTKDASRIAGAAAEVARAMESASRFAELDSYRAATHNKGIMNGVDSVVIATGNDYRAVEAGAHAFASASGRYLPLAVWRRDKDSLVGSLTMPLSLGVVGGTLRVHPSARLALKLLGVHSAAELSLVVAAAGIASNFAAIRALATDGIQRGHMALQARSVATLVGARGGEVERLAAMLSAEGKFNVERAEALLAQLRRDSESQGIGVA